MKTFIKNSKYIVAAVIMITSLCSFSNQASAAYVFKSVDVFYDVTALPNVVPVCNAGAPKTIRLPINSVTIGGAFATDSDGTIASILWSQIGTTPAVASMAGNTTLTPTFSNLVQGVYTFSLSATDNQGASCIPSTMTVTVNPLVINQPPTAIASDPQPIILPNSSVSVFDAGSTDPDGWITAYQWTYVSGPGTYSISAPNSSFTSITNLIEGTYVFQLRVTDNGTPGLTGTDTIVVTVNPAIPPVVIPASGAIYTTENTCTIPLNASTCTVNGLYWWTSGGAGPIKVVDTNPMGAGVVSTGVVTRLATSPLLVYASYPSTTFELRNDLSPVNNPGPQSVTITTNCGANTWNSGLQRCVAPVVNAVCAVSHYACSTGSYLGGGTGGATGPWAWICTGSGGGSNASCSETTITDCNDNADNDGDGKTDFGVGPLNDPGCSSALDDSERNNPKIIEKEL